MQTFQHIYGPLYSWRLGVSLGIDPISTKEKICNFDCVYCQLGKTHHFENERREFVSLRTLMQEIHALPDRRVDHFTFSGRGEPTLAKNLGNMIQELKKEKKGKIAVITNSALLDRADVQEDLSRADYVIAKLDACSQETLARIDKAVPEISFDKIVSGIKSFKGKFKGKLAVQVMFIEENKFYAQHIADVVKDIAPDEVQLDTPLRACGVKPLIQEDLEEFKEYFKGVPISCIYDVARKDIEAISEEQTARRHGRNRRCRGNVNADCAD